jgi:O-antigen/teichoic acid export membrane protein/O-antigen ligase
VDEHHHMQGMRQGMRQPMGTPPSPVALVSPVTSDITDAPTLALPSESPNGSHGRKRTQPPQRARRVGERVPLWLLLLWVILTFDVALAAAFAPIISILGITLTVLGAATVWAYQRGGPFVSGLALLLLSLPFYTTATRFGISLQEVLLYAIWLLGALYSPLGARRWLAQVFSSVSPVVRFAILLFALAAGQSVFRLASLDIVGATTNLRHIVVDPVLLAFIIAYAIRTRRCMPTLIQAFTAGAVLFALYALSLRVLHVGIGIGAVAGRLGAEASFLVAYHPNNLGLYLVFGLAFAPALLIRSLQTRVLSEIKLAAFSGAVTLMLVALWLTYSRGALLAFGAAAGIIVLGSAFLASRRQRRALVMIVAVVVAGSVPVLLAGTPFLGRYLQLLNPDALRSDPNVQFRLNLYQRAWDLIQAHPLTGIGFGGFTQGSSVPFSPHDTYLDMLVSTGVFGIVGLLLLIGLEIVTALRAFSRFRALASPTNALYLLGVAAVLVAFLVQAVTESFTGNPRIFWAVWFFVGVAEGTLFVFTSPSSASAANLTLPPSGMPAPATEDRRDLKPVPAMAESPWALDTAPLPTVSVRDDSASDSSAHLATIWPWRVGSPGSTERFGGVRSTGGPQLDTQARERAVSQELLRRAPVSYVWNQAYTLWYFAMNFLLSVIIARQLSQVEYGVYSILSTIITTLLFLFAFGFEDVAAVFVPRLLGRGGEGAAGGLARRLLLGRMLALVAVTGILVLFIPIQAPLLARYGISLDLSMLSGPNGLALRMTLIAVYLTGTGVAALETALLASVLRSRATLLIGGLSQSLTVAAAALILRLDGGVDGLFGVLATVAWITALAYLVPLRRLLLARSRRYQRPGREIRGLMVTVWLTNITNGALGKQSDILLMGAFAVGYAAIGYYNLAYQLANILGVLLISGLGGVGAAAMSASLGAGGEARLARVWRAVVMLQLFLTVPVLCFSILRADTIITVLYGARYAEAVPLLHLFLVATIVGRLIGGGVHQSALYVIGRQRLVLLNRWAGLVVNITLDLVLIPQFGPYGALAATSLTQVVVGGVEHLLVRRFLPVHYPLAFAGRVLGASALATVCLLWWSPQNLIGLAASFILFVLALAIGLLALGLADTADMQRILELRPGLQARWNRARDRLLGVQGT